MATRKVLVIEDEEAVRDAIRFALEEAGYELFEAPDGIVGLDMLRLATEPLVVLVDLMMPRMSGLELLHEIGKEPDLAMRHAFIVTSAGRALAIPDLAKYLHGGYLSILPKPFEVDDLIARVEEAARYLGEWPGGA